MVRDVSTTLDMTEERGDEHVFNNDTSLQEIDEKIFAIKYELSYISR